jgi:hypothetical protein
MDRFPADFCDPSKEVTYKSRPRECREARNCYRQGRTPIVVGQYDLSGALVTASRLPVFVELDIVELPGMITPDLTGDITESYSCCRQTFCHKIPGACCDCSRPECALCAFPQSGMAYFETLKIKNVGTYRLRFTALEFSLADNEYITYKLHFEEPTPLVTYIIQPGAAETMRVLAQPSIHEIEQETKVFNPQPRLQITDDQGNSGVKTTEGRLIAQLCHTDEEWLNTKRKADYLCPCANMSCMIRSTFAESRELAMKPFFGEVTAQFDSEGFADFTDLAVSIASDRLKIVFQWYSIQTGYQNVYAVSAVFAVRPGALNHIAFVQTKSLNGGGGIGDVVSGNCQRCPDGIHLAGSDLTAKIEVLDRFANRISACRSIRDFCLGVPTATARARLYTHDNGVRGQNSIDVIPASEGEQTEVQAIGGLAHFTRLKVRNVGAFVIVFLVSANQAVEVNVTSAPFRIVSAKPAKMKRNDQGTEMLRGADLEVLRDQPKYELLDAEENRVVSDCYTDCAGKLTSLCTANSSDCNTALVARLTEANGILHGQSTVHFTRGIAAFTDLAIEGAPAVACSSLNFTLQLRSQALNADNCASSATCLFEKIRIQEKVRLLFITFPPVSVLARETFTNGVEIQAEGCTPRSPLRDVSANIVVAIESNAGFGTLTGRKIIKIQDGKARFTDLKLDQRGEGYTLRFSFVGRNQDVSPVISDPFIVQAAAEFLLFQPGRDLTDTRTRAGEPFASQPVLELLGGDRNRVNSNSEVTAKIEVNPARNQEHDPAPASADAPNAELWQLQGTVVVKAKMGIVTFTDLYMKKANVAQGVEGRFKLTFGLGQIKINSGEFDIRPRLPPANKLLVFKQPSDAVAGRAFGSPFIYLVDEFNNRLDRSDMPVESGVRVTVELLGGESGSTLIRDLKQVTAVVESEDGTSTSVKCLQCKGEQPRVCFNPPIPAQCSVMRQDASSGAVEFTDLRIDKAGSGYYLRFYVDGTNLSTISTIFEVQNADPSYPQIMSKCSLPKINRADRPFATQPCVVAYDDFGNPVVVDSLQGRTISVRLTTQGGQDPVPPPYPQVLPPGQEVGTICSIYPDNLVGTTRVLVDTSTGQGVFTDLAVRQVMKNYRLEFTMASSRGDLSASSPQFEVIAGMAKGICNMSIPRAFSQDSPQLLEGRIVCVDEYGNVQPTCETCFDRYCGYSPMNVDPIFDFDCPSEVCVKLYSGPKGICRPFADNDCGAVLSSQSLNGQEDCSQSFCGVDLSGTAVNSVVGSAAFTDLQISGMGPGYRLKFYANVGFEKAFIKREWSYITPPFIVLPTSPTISYVRFSPPMAQLDLTFDRKTNMNRFGTTSISGLQWQVIGDSLPQNGREIFNSALATLLMSKTEFTRKEWDAFGIETPLRKGDFIKSGASHFEPVPTLAIDCRAELHEDFLNTLGDDPRCIWTSTQNLQISLGQNPTVSDETQVLLKEGSQVQFISVVNSVAFASLPATTEEGRIVDGKPIPKYYPIFPSMLPAPSAQVYGLGTLGACSKIQADSGLSSGFAGRLLDSVEWSVDLSKSEVKSGLLESRKSVLEFQERRVHFSSFLLGDLNVITVTLRPTAKLPQGTNITLTGIPTDSDFYQGCKRYNVSIVDEPCLAADGMCKTMPLYGPGSDVFSISPGLGNIPAAQAKDGNIFLVIREGKLLDDARNTVLQIRIRNPLDPRMKTDVGFRAKCEKCICFDQICEGKSVTSVNILWMQSQTNCKRVCEIGGGTLEFRDAPVTVVSGVVFESSAAAGTMNTITMVLQISTAIGAGSEIHIWGFESFTSKTPKCALGRDALALICETCPAGTSNSLKLHRDGHMVFTVRNGTVVNNVKGEVILAIRLKNPDTPGLAVTPKANIIYSRSSPTAQRWEDMSEDFFSQATTLSGNVLSGLDRPSFQVFELVESNRVKGANNWITMRFSANTDMPAITQISVIGLHNGADLAEIPLYSLDDRHLCFRGNSRRGVATWQKNTSQLVLIVAEGCEISAFAVVTVSFKLHSPKKTGTGRVPSLKASHQGCQSCNLMSCACTPDDVTAFTLPEIFNSRAVFGAESDPSFIHSSICDDNPVAGEMNTISIALVPGVELLSGSNITLSGLIQTLTFDSQIFVKYGDNSSAGNATFDHKSGVLMLMLNRVQSKGIQFVLKFDLRNNYTSPVTQFNVETNAIIAICGTASTTACPMPRADATDVLEVPPQRLHGNGVCNAFALGDSPRFWHASIRESTVVYGASNVIIVALKANFDVHPGARLTLTGLMNSGTVSHAGLTAVNEFGHLFPNCSCDVMEVERCSLSGDCKEACASCSLANEMQLASQFRVWQPENLFGDAEYSGIYPTGKTIDGTWDYDGGSMTLQVAKGKYLPSRTLLLVAFVLTNAKSTVPAVQAKVTFSQGTGSDEILIAEYPLDGRVLGAALPPTFSVSEFRETTSIDGGFSEIEISLEPNCPVVSPRSPGAQVIVNGLNVFEDASQYLNVSGGDRFDIARSGIAYWDRDYGRLILAGSTIIGGCASLSDAQPCSLDMVSGLVKRKITFRFNLKKMSERIVNASNLEISVDAFGMSMESVKMTQSTVSPLRLPRATFIASSVQENNRVLGNTNQLQVSLQLNTDLGAGSSITITGLVDTLTQDGTLEIGQAQKSHMPLFGTRGEWTQDVGRLVLTVQSGFALASRQSFVFTFTVRNRDTFRHKAADPIRPKVSATLRRSDSPLHVPVDEVYMEIRSENILSPYQIPSFYERRISVEHQVKHAVNTVTCSLRANVRFPIGARITLVGLSSNTRSGKLQIDGPDKDLFGSKADWFQSAGELTLNVTAEYQAFSQMMFSFQLQNRGVQTSSVTGIRAEGGPLLKEIVLGAREPQRLLGTALDGAATVSWMVKAARESTQVRNQINAVTFTIRPNAPIYGGSTLTISGLYRTRTESCQLCTGQKDLIPGMGCSSACAACISTGSTTCLPIFEETPSTQTHPLFENGLGIFNKSAGTLMLAIREGGTMPSTRDTVFTLMLRNTEFANEKAECGRQSSLQSIAAGLCMTLTSSRVVLCQTAGPLGNNCDHSPPSANITFSDVPVSPFNFKLPDTCPICIRNQDLVAMDYAVRTIGDYSIVDLAVYPPSLNNMPTLIEGGAALGDYVLVLRLKNWLGLTDEDRLSFEKVEGTDGPLETEKYIPSVYISGQSKGSVDLRELYSHQTLDLFAVAKPANCKPGTPAEYLKISWKIMRCIRSSASNDTRELCMSDQCKESVSFVGLNFSNTSRNLHIPSYSLPAGQTFRATVTVQQADLSTSTQACIHTRVRPVVPVLKGAGSFVSRNVVSLKLQALDSFDPEFKTSGASSDKFLYEWTCRRHRPLQGSTECNIDESARFIKCPDEVFVSCPDDFLSVVLNADQSSSGEAEMSQTALQSGFENSAREFGPFVYRIGVRVSRKLQVLAPEIRNNPSFQSASTEQASVTFSVRKSSALPVTVIRCDPSKLDDRNLCKEPSTSKRIGNRQKIVLHAAYGNDRGTSRLPESSSFQWSVISELGSYFLDAPNVLTSIYAQTLIIKSGSVLPGQRVSFRATIKSEGITGFAELDVYVNVPPVGGVMQIRPASGIAMIDQFIVGTRGWTSDSESLPLTYRFTVHSEGKPSNQILIFEGKSNEFVGSLPPGNVRDSSLKIDAQVIDAWGSDAFIASSVNVGLPPNADFAKLQNDHMVPYLQNIRALNDNFELPQMISLVSGTLNGIVDVCATTVSGSGSYSCEASKTIRPDLRHQLLADLDDFFHGAIASAPNAFLQASLLRLILDRPDDVKIASAAKAFDIASKIRTNAMTVQGEVEDIARVLGFALSRLLQAVKLQQATTQGAQIQRQWTKAILEEISALSALSVESAFSGFAQSAFSVERPRILTFDAFSVSTSRVAVASISGDEARSHFSMPGIKVTLPKDLFSNSKNTLLDKNSPVDVMLVAWDPAFNPVPGSTNTVVGFEVRIAGTDFALNAFAVDEDTGYPTRAGPLDLPLSSAMQLDLPMMQKISKYVDPFTGRGSVPFVMRFDLDSWKWPLSDTWRTSSTETSIRAGTYHFGLFSVQEVYSGCDGVALSPLTFDHCMICGGDNSTCSGCDWIPNSGRDRRCSGHGRCGVDRCMCVRGWYGIMCQNSCTDEILCSGHGQCEPKDGLSCQCDEFWESESKFARSGPYCTRQQGGMGTIGTYVVKIVLSLPMSKMLFHADKQQAFKSSLAKVAGVSTFAVTIDSITSISSRRSTGNRRLLAESIRVDTSLFAADPSAAQAMKTKLTAENINSELMKNGLPSATVLEVATTEAIHTPVEKASLTMILAISVPVGVVVLCVVSAVYWYVTRQARQAAALRKTILDFGQTHTHLEGGINKQIMKTKTNIHAEKYAVVVAAGVPMHQFR